jgi:hypothetical protein
MDIVFQVNMTMSPRGHLGLTNHQGHTYIPFLTDVLILKFTKLILKLVLYFGHINIFIHKDNFSPSGIPLVKISTEELLVLEFSFSFWSSYS